MVSVNLLSANRIFGTLRVLKTSTGAVLRLTRTSGKVEDFPLYTGWQGVMIGTNVFDVQLTAYGCRIKRTSGSAKFFAPGIVW